MSNLLTSLTFLLLTLLSLVAWAAALHRLRHPSDSGKPGTLQQWLVGTICMGSGALFFVRWLAVHSRWQPVAAHVDGLALMAMLFAGVILYVQNRRRLFGLSAFALPVLTFILAWGICAATWTADPFDLGTLHPVWKGMHLVGVYLGTLCAAVAAVAGGMFLFVQRRLKHKQGLATFGHLASLEALETMIVRTATLGFVLLTLGLIAGLVVLSETASTTINWWYGPKIALAVTAWLVYALVMNVRYTSRFRGTRAAWLAIGGLVLLLVTYGLITALPQKKQGEKTTAPQLVHQNESQDASQDASAVFTAPIAPRGSGGLARTPMHRPALEGGEPPAAARGYWRWWNVRRSGMGERSSATVDHAGREAL